MRAQRVAQVAVGPGIGQRGGSRVEVGRAMYFTALPPPNAYGVVLQSRNVEVAGVVLA